MAGWVLCPAGAQSDLPACWSWCKRACGPSQSSQERKGGVALPTASQVVPGHLHCSFLQGALPSCSAASIIFSCPGMGGRSHMQGTCLPLRYTAAWSQRQSTRQHKQSKANPLVQGTRPTQGFGSGAQACPPQAPHRLQHLHVGHGGPGHGGGHHFRLWGNGIKGVHHLQRQHRIPGPGLVRPAHSTSIRKRTLAGLLLLLCASKPFAHANAAC